ncbi:glycosyltransferase family 4 protein [Lichenicoccus sp.]|uniref:glycosyltransferase family 4 protein n=1 Tax=Lichenicoccus sp. TaxID=2781899 RepID=UPI003D12CDFC
MRRILIVSDAWMPQVNGVVRTLSTVAGELRGMGHVVEVIGPDRFRNVPCPTYPDIRLSLLPGRRLARMIAAFRPDALHIATEGPLGLAARHWAMRRGAGFTTSFHTRFPEYIQARTGLPPGPAYALLRWFHNASAATLVATETLSQTLAARGFTRLLPWSRGVDLQRFRPEPREDWTRDWNARRPVFLYVGRIAVEKNIEAFLDLELPGSKVVVGGGPMLAALKLAYPDVVFTGPRAERALAQSYAGADVFVFPSRTDTFGLVILEALACGVPVAAYDVMGPRDILRGAAGRPGAVSDDLREACLEALQASRADARAHAERFGWRACAELFLASLVPLAAAPARAVRRGTGHRDA